MPPSVVKRSLRSTDLGAFSAVRSDGGFIGHAANRGRKEIRRKSSAARKPRSCPPANVPHPDATNARWPAARPAPGRRTARRSPHEKARARPSTERGKNAAKSQQIPWVGWPPSNSSTKSRPDQRLPCLLLFHFQALHAIELRGRVREVRPSGQIGRASCRERG